MGVFASRILTTAVPGGGSSTSTNVPDLSAAQLDVVTGHHLGGTRITLSDATGIDRGAVALLDGVAHGVEWHDETSVSIVVRGVAVSAVDGNALDLEIINPNGESDTLANAFTYTLFATLTEFTSGAAMDAKAVVGGIYRLVGATTGAEIVVLQCVQTSPSVLYRMKGRARWYQATGTEFDGVFKWVAVGAAGSITWGATPGSRTDGGLKHGGGGTIELQGIELQGDPAATHCLKVYAAAWDTAPATGRCVLSCWTRSAINTSIYGGGVGYTGTSPRLVACSATSRDTPTLAYSGTAVTMTTGAEWLIVSGKYPNASGNTTAYGIAQTGTVAAHAPGGSNGAGIQGTSESRPAICKVGDSNIFFLETYFVDNRDT